MRARAAVCSGPQYGSPPSPRKTYGLAFATETVTDRGGIYVYGGRNASGISVNDVYRFDLGTQLWSFVDTRGDLPSPRVANGFTANAGNLFVFGGSDNAGLTPKYN